MNRILSLQKLSGSSIGLDYIAASNKSNYCSSETTACSTESNHCEGGAELAW